jgi:predicted Zn-dependent peptidase
MQKLILTFIVSMFMLQSFGQNYPLKVESYKLENGLTVYLNEDHTMPMIHGMVVVKGGSKRDPADATGIAHYFEHIMFKGTEELGTIDYAKEKVYLDSIAGLYDNLRATTDKDKRMEIQKEINRISVAAANYAIPNELDKALNEMGAKGVNAGTGYESIVYYNSFPSNQINKWIELYSHRFMKPVFRLFQSELETVYEEKNMYADDAMSVMFEEYLKNFYKGTPYAMPVIGTTHDLKNPSLSKMKAYFDKYYVAKNMALVLTGDFDSEKIKPLIKEKFGQWRSGETPEPLNIKLTPFKGRELVKKRMTPIKVGLLGYQSIPRNHPDELGLELISALLTNEASTGLLDQLRNDNKLMFAGMFNDFHDEIGGTIIFYVPKIIGQSLAKAEKMVLEQINKLKSGNFDDELLQGIKVELKKQYEEDLEDMRWRAYAISDAFLYGISWEKYLTTPSKIDKITKEDLVQLANKYFTDNYLAFYSKMGFPKKDKVDKPPFKPVNPKNTEKKSEYAKKLEQIPIADMKPRFIEFNKDVFISEINKNITLYTTPNPINNIFSVRLVFGKGDYRNPMLSQAVSAMEYAHPKGMDFKTFKQKLQLLGCSFYSFSSLDKTSIIISGLEENLEASLKLINDMMNNLDINQDDLQKLAEDYKMNLKYEAKDVNTKDIALSQYALYGKNSDFIDRLTLKQVKELKANQLIANLNDVFKYAYDIHYCGKLSPEEFSKTYKKIVNPQENLKEKTAKIEKPREKYSQNTILFLNDKKSVQSQIRIYIEGEVNDKESRIAMAGFNDYLDGSMASLLFQEIREFRSLAYGVSGYYSPSFYFDKPGYFKGWLSTQNDKTLEAIDVYTGIIKNLPEKPERIDEIRKNLTISINAGQPMFRYKSLSVANWRAQGYTNDPRKERYDKYLTLSFDEIIDFYNKNLKGKAWLITIVGNEKRFNLDELKKYGKVEKIDLDKLFTK